MISIVIPAYNEGRAIANTINSILPQIRRGDEIIVGASACTDNTEEVIKQLGKKHRNLKLLSQKSREGKSIAMNLLVKKAKSDIIVQTDADVILEKNAIKNLLKHFRNREIGAVSGRPIPTIPKENIFYYWTEMSYRRMHELRLKQDKEGEFWHLSGYLCAFRKESFSELPKAKGAVDALMAFSIKNKGYKIAYEPKARVLVKCPLTVKDFINQKARVRAGYYFLSKQKKMPRTARSEIFYFPIELFRLPITRWPAFFFSAMVYSYSWIKGWIFFKKDSSLNEIWKRVDSTK